jgi:hypothetical protein
MGHNVHGENYTVTMQELAIVTNGLFETTQRAALFLPLGPQPHITAAQIWPTDPKLLKREKPKYEIEMRIEAGRSRPMSVGNIWRKLVNDGTAGQFMTEAMGGAILQILHGRANAVRWLATDSQSDARRGIFARITIRGFTLKDVAQGLNVGDMGPQPQPPPSEEELARYEADEKNWDLYPADRPFKIAPHLLSEHQND